MFLWRAYCVWFGRKKGKKCICFTPEIGLPWAMNGNFHSKPVNFHSLSQTKRLWSITCPKFASTLSLIMRRGIWEREYSVVPNLSVNLLWQGISFTFHRTDSSGFHTFWLIWTGRNLIILHDFENWYVFTVFTYLKINIVLPT